MNPLRLLINGARGRMGQAILAALKDDPEATAAAAIDQGDDFLAALESAKIRLIIGTRLEGRFHELILVELSGERQDAAPFELPRHRPGLRHGTTVATEDIAHLCTSPIPVVGERLDD